MGLKKVTTKSTGLYKTKPGFFKKLIISITVVVLIQIPDN